MEVGTAPFFARGRIYRDIAVWAGMCIAACAVATLSVLGHANLVLFVPLAIILAVATWWGLESVLIAGTIIAGFNFFWAMIAQAFSREIPSPNYLFALPWVFCVLVGLRLVAESVTGYRRLTVSGIDRLVIIWGAIVFLQAFNPNVPLGHGLGEMRPHLFWLALYWGGRAAVQRHREPVTLIRVIGGVALLINLFALWRVVAGITPLDHLWISMSDKLPEDLRRQESFAVARSFTGEQTGYLIEGVVRPFRSSINSGGDIWVAMTMALLTAAVVITGGGYRKLAIAVGATWLLVLVLFPERTPIMLTLIAAGAVVVPLTWRPHMRRRAIIAGLGAIAVVVAIVAFSARFAQSDKVVLRRLAELANPLESPTLVWRFVNWGMWTGDVIAQPWGHGTGSAQRYIEAVNIITTPHNKFLAVAYETGIPGLLIWIVLMTALLRLGFREAQGAGTPFGRILGVAVFANVVIVFAYGMTYEVLYYAEQLVFWLTAGMLVETSVGNGERTSITAAVAT